MGVKWISQIRGNVLFYNACYGKELSKTSWAFLASFLATLLYGIQVLLLSVNIFKEPKLIASRLTVVGFHILVLQRSSLNPASPQSVYTLLSKKYYRHIHGYRLPIILGPIRITIVKQRTVMATGNRIYSGSLGGLIWNQNKSNDPAAVDSQFQLVENIWSPEVLWTRVANSSSLKTCAKSPNDIVVWRKFHPIQLSKFKVCGFPCLFINLYQKCPIQEFPATNGLFL